MKLEIGKWKLAAIIVLAAVAPLVWLAATYPSGPLLQPFASVVDTQTITVAGATITSNPITVPYVKSAHISWTFGAVVGSYTGCTVQAKTAYDGINFTTLGSAVSITVAGNTIEEWDIYEQMGSSSGVTTTTPSTSAALSFGQVTEFVLACSGYGTSAAVTQNVIYR